jgi:hypothetical protein
MKSFLPTHRLKKDLTAHTRNGADCIFASLIATVVPLWEALAAVAGGRSAPLDVVLAVGMWQG